LFGARTRGNAGTHDVALGHVGFTAVRRRTRTPRQAGDCWSVCGAEALRCVVLWAPRFAPRVAPACVGRPRRLWPLARRTACRPPLVVATRTAFAPCRDPLCDDSRDPFSIAHCL
jgi:hypothetical protein